MTISLLTNYYFVSFITAWILSILLKSLISMMTSKGSSNLSKKFSLKKGFENGGMPSSHSAVVSAITMAVLLTTGLSDLFFVSMVFSAIIISDAFRLRYNVGIQAEKLNILLKRSKQETIEVIYGHTFPQVIAGIILGSMASIIVYFLYF